MDIYGKMAYLKGLLDGMELADSKEKKLFAEIIDVLDELVEAVGDLYEEQDELQEYVESIDTDLEDAEELLEIIDDDLGLVEEVLGIDDVKISASVIVMTTAIATGATMMMKMTLISSK